MSAYTLMPRCPCRRTSAVAAPSRAAWMLGLQPIEGICHQIRQVRMSIACLRRATPIIRRVHISYKLPIFRQILQAGSPASLSCVLLGSGHRSWTPIYALVTPALLPLSPSLFCNLVCCPWGSALCWTVYAVQASNNEQHNVMTM